MTDNSQATNSSVTEFKRTTLNTTPLGGTWKWLQERFPKWTEANPETFEIQILFRGSVRSIRGWQTAWNAGDKTGIPWGVQLPADIFAAAVSALESGVLVTAEQSPIDGNQANIKAVKAAVEKYATKPEMLNRCSAADAAALISLAESKSSRPRFDWDVYKTFAFVHGGSLYRLSNPTGPRKKGQVGQVANEDATTDDEVVEFGLLHMLQQSANLVLEGVPGTGKTHAIGELKTAVLRVTGSGARPLRKVLIRLMTMHPSTSYEDFVEGLRPAGGTPNSSSSRSVRGADHENWFFKPFDAPKAGFAVKNGFFVEACVYAVENPEEAVVVVLDELNRCNIPKVLGDLMTVIEESKRAHWDGSAWVVDSATKGVTLPYSDRKLFVPDNLFIVGTMNTTDRSVAPMDAALRRRFSFHRIWPQGFGPAAATAKAELEKRLGTSEEITKSLHLWRAINAVLLAKYGADAMLGHSYLDDLSRALKRTDANAAEVVAYHWNHRILPQLMDVIASNGLTRSFVVNPRKFFGEDGAPDLTKADNVKIFGDKLVVTVSGEGSLRSAEIRWPAAP